MLHLSVEAQNQGRYFAGGPREYEGNVIDALASYANIPGFEKTWGGNTQWAIDHHCGDDLNGITARDFLDRIIKYPPDMLKDRIEHDCTAWRERNKTAQQ